MSGWLQVVGCVTGGRLQTLVFADRPLVCIVFIQ